MITTNKTILLCPFSGDTIDYSGKSHNATWVGTPTYVDSPIGKGASVTGVRYLRYDDHNDFSFINGLVDAHFTISFWINPTTLPATGYVISKYGTSANREWAVILYSNGDISLNLYSGSANVRGSRMMAGIQANKWQHVVLSYSGLSTSQDLYIFCWVDGVYKPFLATTGAGTYTKMANTAGAVLIGRSQSTASFSYSGGICGLRIMNGCGLVFSSGDAQRMMIGLPPLQDNEQYIT